jgi:hypothetical protein
MQLARLGKSSQIRTLRNQRLDQQRCGPEEDASSSTTEIKFFDILSSN